MYRKVEGEKPQLVLPTKYIPTVCNAHRDDMGHQGYEKTLGLIRSRFFWPGMSKGGFTTVVAVSDLRENQTERRWWEFKHQNH